MRLKDLQLVPVAASAPLPANLPAKLPVQSETKFVKERKLTSKQKKVVADYFFL